MKISNCCSAPIKENTDICSKCGEHCVEEEQDKAILRINDQEVELTKEQEREVQKILEKVYAEPEQSEEEGKEDWISEKMKEFDEIIKSRTCFGHIEDEDFEPLKSLPYSIGKSNADLGDEIFTLGYPRNDIVYGVGYLASKTGFWGH